MTALDGPALHRDFSRGETISSPCDNLLLARLLRRGTTFGVCFDRFAIHIQELRARGGPGKFMGSFERVTPQAFEQGAIFIH